MMNILFYKRIPDFHSIFLSAFIAFNFIGLYEFSFYRYPLNTEVTYIFFFGLLGFVWGMIVGKVAFLGWSGNSRWALRVNVVKYSNIRYITYFYFPFIFIAAVYINRNGLVIFNDNLRYENSALATLSTLLFSIILYYYYAYVKLSKKNDWIFYVICFVYLLVLLSYGYRSPIITFLFVIFLIKQIIDIKLNNKKADLNYVAKLLILVVIFLLIAIVIEYFRVTQNDEYLDAFRNIYVGSEDYLIISLLPFLSLARYDQEVIEKLYIYFQSSDYLNLSLLLSNPSTFLPGEQLSARTIVGSIVTDHTTESGRPWSITSALQGGLYADGGLVLVFAGFFVMSFFMYFLKVKLANKVSIFMIVAYSFLSVTFFKSIHTGYIDASIYILIIFMWFINFVLKLRVQQKFPYL